MASKSSQGRQAKVPDANVFKLDISKKVADITARRISENHDIDICASTADPLGYGVSE